MCFHDDLDECRSQIPTFLCDIYSARAEDLLCSPLTTPTDLDRVDLGGLAAEEDTNLEKYFLATREFAKVRDEQAFLVLGQKGSGKSTIALMIADERKGNVLDLSPNQFLWTRVKEFTQLGVPSPHAEKYAWSLTIFQAIANWIIYALRDTKSEKREAIREFLCQQHLLLNEPAFLDTLRNQPSRVGASFGSAVELSYVKEPTPPDKPVMAELEREFQNADVEIAASGSSLAVVIDKLDEFWDNTTASNNRLIGLLLAVREINYRLKHIKLFLLLRSDIYRALLFPDKDKFPGVTVEIRWNEGGLIDLLQKRVAVSLSADATDKTAIQRIMVTEVTGVRGRAGTRRSLDYIIDRIHERPRDLLTYCHYAKEQALSRKHSIIESDDIVDAETKFSETKRDNIRAEYSLWLPNIDTFLESLARSRERVSNEVLQRTLQDACAKTSLQFESALRKLIECEILGVVDKGAELYYYREPSIVERVGFRSTVYCIHPSLRRALRTIEVRGFA